VVLGEWSVVVDGLDAIDHGRVVERPPFSGRSVSVLSRSSLSAVDRPVLPPTLPLVRPVPQVPLSDVMAPRRQREAAGPSDADDVERTLAAHASERVDAASTALVAATLAMVAAAAIAVASVRGETWLIAVAGALCVAAGATVSLVRWRIATELRVVAEANGLPPAAARALARTVLGRALRLD
jgi:hypothetical protein